MSSDNSKFPKINQEQSILYKKKLIYFSSKAFIYGGILSLLFRKPKTFLPLTLGLAAGYCHNDMIKIFSNNFE